MTKTIVIDTEFDSYRSFFDHAWSRLIMDMSNGSPLEQPVFDLCTAWRGAANTHTMPYLMLQMFPAFVQGFAKHEDPIGKKLVAALATRLVGEMGDSLRHMQRKRLQQVVDKLDTELRIALDENQPTVDLQKEWRSYLDMSEFQFCLWGSQRLCYAGVYYAYEDFVVRCIKLATGKHKCKTNDKEFKSDFRAHFGQHLLDDCWLRQEINVARLVRHSLVHCGGIVTDPLKQLKHGLRVTGGEIQVQARDTSQLFHLLKDCSLKLTEAGVAALLKGGPAS